MKKAIIIASLGLAVFGCAKTTIEDADVFEQRALDAWMEKHHPEATQTDDGGYYEILTAPAPDAERVTVGKWLKISYTITDLEGNVIIQQNEQLARQEGTFTKYTHYVPDFVYLAETNSTMIRGQYLNLLEMSAGEVRRLYLPSKLGYGSSSLSNSVGYGGQYSLPGSKPFIIDSLRVIEIVDDAQEADYQAVDARATLWGIDLADSIKSHYYLEKLFTKGLLGDSVRADSTARIYYVGRLLDGFIFDTNIDSIRQRVYGEIRVPADTAALVYKKSTATAIPSSIFVKAEKHLLYGDSIRMIVSSIYAYGSSGRTGSSTGTTGSGSSITLIRTEIQPYTPLIYDFVVLSNR